MLPVMLTSVPPCCKHPSLSYFKLITKLGKRLSVLRHLRMSVFLLPSFLPRTTNLLERVATIPHFSLLLTQCLTALVGCPHSPLLSRKPLPNGEACSVLALGSVAFRCPLSVFWGKNILGEKSQTLLSWFVSFWFTDSFVFCFFSSPSYKHLLSQPAHTHARPSGWAHGPSSACWCQLSGRRSWPTRLPVGTNGCPLTNSALPLLWSPRPAFH